MQTRAGEPANFLVAPAPTLAPDCFFQEAPAPAPDFFSQAAPARVPGIFFQVAPALASRGKKKPAPAPDYLQNIFFPAN